MYSCTSFVLCNLWIQIIQIGVLIYSCVQLYVVCTMCNFWIQIIQIGVLIYTCCLLFVITPFRIPTDGFSFYTIVLCLCTMFNCWIQIIQIGVLIYTCVCCLVSFQPHPNSWLQLPIPVEKRYPIPYWICRTRLLLTK